MFTTRTFLYLLSFLALADVLLLFCYLPVFLANCSIMHRSVFKVVLCLLLADELGISMTVDEYSEQLHELKLVYFPKAELLPGTVDSISVLFQCTDSNIFVRFP